MAGQNSQPPIIHSQHVPASNRVAGYGLQPAQQSGSRIEQIDDFELHYYYYAFALCLNCRWLQLTDHSDDGDDYADCMVHYACSGLLTN